MQTTNLKTNYRNEIKAKLKSALGKKNILEVPKLEKIVLNTSFGKISPDEKTRERIENSIAKITGQKPIITKAKKAIAAFKLQKGQPVGAKVTLRGNRMYDFFEKVVRIVLPRLRDFRGASTKSLDGRGNYTIAFREITIFPEIEYARTEKPIGLEVTIQTNAKNDEEAKLLLSELGMPFQREKAD